MTSAVPVAVSAVAAMRAVPTTCAWTQAGGIDGGDGRVGRGLHECRARHLVASRIASLRAQPKGVALGQADPFRRHQDRSQLLPNCHLAVPDTAPTDAVTRVAPLPVAVTSPLPRTVATVASPVVQVTAAFGMACPFWSRTVAVS